MDGAMRLLSILFLGYNQLPARDEIKLCRLCFCTGDSAITLALGQAH